MRLASSSNLGTIPNDAAFSHHAALFGPGVFFADPFYSDALSRTGYPVASQIPIIIVQAPPPATAPPEPTQAPAQPLMIELQGERYVRVSGEETSGAEMIDRDTIQLRRPATPSEVARASSATHKLVPVLLVFRDGHHEEVSDYTIANGILYASGNYYTNGYWNKKIDLTTLNLAGTQQANANRNVNFVLPSSPNEVITRP
jgi:hypothetical protein